jgi:hypothetical protein
MTTIPAITLWQPWATLIAIGAKPYETRSRRPPKRLVGQRIAIHAAQRMPVRSMLTDEEHLAIMIALKFKDYRYLPRGKVVCTAILADVSPAHLVPRDLFGKYGVGRFAWKLTDVRPLDPPIYARGTQQWGWPWTPPADFQFHETERAAP